MRLNDRELRLLLSLGEIVMPTGRFRRAPLGMAYSSTWAALRGKGLVTPTTNVLTDAGWREVEFARGGYELGPTSAEVIA